MYRDVLATTILRMFFLFAMVTLTIETTRFSNILLQPEAPAHEEIDENNDSPPEIGAGISLDELNARHRAARKMVRAYEANPKNPKFDQSEYDLIEPYRTESQLHHAVNSRERLEAARRELRYFWFCGLALIVGGVLCYNRFSPWLGLPLLIAGFGDMLGDILGMKYGLSSSDGLQLINEKMVFAVLSIVLLLLVAWRTGLLRRNEFEEYQSTRDEAESDGTGI